MDDELVDDVFEDDIYNPKNYYQNTNTDLSLSEATFLNEETPSPTGLPSGFRTQTTAKLVSNGDDDGWKSFRIEDDSEFDENTLHKVILLGDSSVGKTSFIVKYHMNEFRPASFSATVGIALTTKIVQLEDSSVKLQIWDTAGQERFKSISFSYYRDAHALLLLYDVTKKTSFENIRAWLGEIREYAQENVIIMLLGNKADCPDRQVAREDGERLAREYDVAFMETSAKTGLNVDLAFQAVARKLKSRKADSVDECRFNVQDYVNEKTSRIPSCPQCM